MCADHPTSEWSSAITPPSPAPEPRSSGLVPPLRGTDSGGAIPTLTTLAEKLTWLFDTVLQPNGKRYPLRAVEDWCKANRGTSVAHGYLAQLKNGRKTRPSAEVLDALAAFFHAPRPIFSTDPERIRSAAAVVLLAQEDRRVGTRKPTIDVTGLTAEQIQDLAARRDTYRQHNTDNTAT